MKIHIFTTRFLHFSKGKGKKLVCFTVKVAYFIIEKKENEQKVKQTPTKLWNYQPQAILGYHVKLR